MEKGKSKNWNKKQLPQEPLNKVEDNFKAHVALIALPPNVEVPRARLGCQTAVCQQKDVDMNELILY